MSCDERWDVKDKNKCVRNLKCKEINVYLWFKMSCDERKGVSNVKEIIRKLTKLRLMEYVLLYT